MSSSGRCLLATDEREQIIVHLLLVRRAHAVQKARVNFKPGAFDDPGSAIAETACATERVQELLIRLKRRQFG